MIVDVILPTKNDDTTPAGGSIPLVQVLNDQNQVIASKLGDFGQPGTSQSVAIPLTPANAQAAVKAVAKVQNEQGTQSDGVEGAPPDGFKASKPNPPTGVVFRNQ